MDWFGIIFVLAVVIVMVVWCYGCATMPEDW